MGIDYRYISGDTHLEVPAWRWTNRVPEKYRDRAPRTVRLANGGDALLVEGQPLRENANDMYGGKGDAWRPNGNNYDNTPGTGTPAERLKCLDQDGMDAEIMFHGVGHGPRTWRSIRDDDAYKACIRAYNDFIAEEYAAFCAGPLPPDGRHTADQRRGRVGGDGALREARPQGRHAQPLPQRQASYRRPKTTRSGPRRSGSRCRSRSTSSWRARAATATARWSSSPRGPACRTWPTGS